MGVIVSTEKLPGGGARATARIDNARPVATLGLEGPGQARIDDGPAQGCVFHGVRLPEFLRVVHVPGQRAYRHGQQFDCLDQLDDATRPGEVVEVYRQRTWAHYRGSGYIAAYVWVTLQDGVRATAADNTAWRELVEHVLGELPAVEPGQPPMPVFACRR